MDETQTTELDESAESTEWDEDDEFDFSTPEWVLITLLAFGIPVYLVNLTYERLDGFWADATVFALWSVGDLVVAGVCMLILDGIHRLFRVAASAPEQGDTDTRQPRPSTDSIRQPGSYRPRHGDLAGRSRS